MIAALTIIGIAFYWLLRETDYLRVRLPVGYIECELDIDFDHTYDGSDFIYYSDYELLLEKAIEDKAYQDWLTKEREPKLVYGGIDRTSDYPQYNWQAVEEGLTKRRNGEMLYQRGVR